MADEAAPAVDEEAQLLVRNLVGHKRDLRRGRREVARWSQSCVRTLDAGVLRQVVHHRLGRVDVVIDERLALRGPFATQHRHAREREMTWL